MDDLVSHDVILTAGKDREDRHILIVNGCRFPDPKSFDYEDFLDALFKRLDDFVAREYVIIFFAAPMKHMPQVGWMINAWKRMSRNYKKNVKKFYVVHPSWWFKAVLFVMQKIVSSKFAQKIVNIERLADLPIQVPMESVEVPEEVQEYDRKQGNPEPASTATTPQAPNRARERGSAGGVRHGQRRRGDVIFGAQLSSAVADEEEAEAPIPILALIEHLHANALNEEGIFRTSPNKTDINELKERLDRGLSVQWDDYEMATLAGLLKAYVRELPDPLIPRSTYPNLLDVEVIEGQSALVHYIRQSFLDAMGERERRVLADICYLLRDVAVNEAVNQMGLKALAMVWAPNIIRPESMDEEMQLNKAARKLVECLIEYCELIFPQK